MFLIFTSRNIVKVLVMYSVPLIPPDLRHEETIIQAALSLDCLQKTINSVFEKINARIERNNEKFENLNYRINKAQEIIQQKLVGTTKAIKIFSPARFPSSQVFNDIPLTFSKTTIAETIVIENEELLDMKYEVQSDVEANESPNEKLFFVHLNTTEMISMRGGISFDKALVCKAQQKGLGAIPKNLRSINSTLLFNTDHRVYGFEDEQHTVPWKRTNTFKNQTHKHSYDPSSRLTTVKQLLEPPPPSLANRNQKVTPSGGLRYMPKLNEAPELDLPIDLPDLPGIADDINFEFNEPQQIAPSLFIDNLPDVPETKESIESIDDALKLEQKSKSSNIPELLKNASENKKENKTIQNSKSIALSPSPSPSLPPPPPPPPPPLRLIENSIVNQKSPREIDSAEQLNVVAPLEQNSRSQLMDAIRQAGGAKGGRLRSTTNSNTNTSANEINSKTRLKSSGKTGGGDLMADLHQKLLMRRKGISGAKDLNNPTLNAAGSTAVISTSSNPVISRLSSLIPPPIPPKPSDNEDDNENDGDWTD